MRQWRHRGKSMIHKSSGISTECVPGPGMGSVSMGCPSKIALSNAAVDVTRVEAAKSVSGTAGRWRPGATRR